MTADAAPVLAYDRPLAPGAVRITRSSTSVSIKIAPDTAKRALFHLAVPAILFVFATGLAVSNLRAANGLFGMIVAATLLAIGGALVYQTLRQSREPIAFTADPKMLRIEHPLDVPPDRTLGVFEIETLRLRRHPLVASAYELEVITRDFPDRPRTVISLLVSPSFETLDKIGRTLAEAMRLSVHPAHPEGWRTYDDDDEGMKRAEHVTDSVTADRRFSQP
jgi:hypothetical protein